MKERPRGFILCCCLYFSNAVICNTASGFENEPDGFRSIKWGTDISLNQQEMYHLTDIDDEGMKHYVRIKSKELITEKDKEEAMKKYVVGINQETVGEAKVDYIVYSYYKNKFYMVILNTHGKSNRESLIRTFVTLFGAPNIPYEWWGDETNIKIECSPATADCIAGFYSVKIKRQKNIDKADVTKKELEETKKKLIKNF